MNKKLRMYLETIGLKASASEEDAKRYLASLTGKEAEVAKALADGGSAFVDENGDGKCDNCGNVEDECTCESAEPTDGDAEKKKEEEKAAREAKLAKLNREKAPIAISVGADNRASLPDMLSDAVVLRANGPSTKLYSKDGKPRPAASGAEQTARLSLVDIGRKFLQAHGYPVSSMNIADLRRALWSRNADAWSPTPLGAAGGMTTSDFGAVLLNAMNKSLLRAYTEAAPIWPKFCKKVTVPDFRENVRVNLGEAPPLQKIPEGGGYNYVSLSDRKEKYKLAKYGYQLSQSWESLINDNLNAFSRVPQAVVRAARRLEDTLPLELLTGNGNLGDGNPIFAAARGNIATGTGGPGAINTARLNAALLAFRTQTGSDESAVLNLEPSVLIVPASREAEGKKYLESPSDPDVTTHEGVVNQWKGRLDLAVAPWFDALGEDGWFLAVNPGVFDSIELAFLEGNEMPYFEMLDATNPDSRDYYVRHCCAAAVVDPKGLYYCPAS